MVVLRRKASLNALNAKDGKWRLNVKKDELRTASGPQLKDGLFV
jgi:hypothetical protein